MRGAKTWTSMMNICAINMLVSTQLLENNMRCLSCSYPRKLDVNYAMSRVAGCLSCSYPRKLDRKLPHVSHEWQPRDAGARGSQLTLTLIHIKKHVQSSTERAERLPPKHATKKCLMGDLNTRH